jgi:hypothetical protein
MLSSMIGVFILQNDHCEKDKREDNQRAADLSEEIAYRARGAAVRRLGAAPL